MSLLRNILNRIRRPSKVTRAQHDHVRRHPHCAACGGMRFVQGHHIQPYHKFPELGADPLNFISLCESRSECHLLLGHGGAFKFYNPNVVADAATFLGANDVLRRSVVNRARALRLVDA